MKILKTLSGYVLQMVQRKGTTSLGGIVKAYRRTAKGKRSTLTDAQLASKAKKTLVAAASIATTSVATHLIAMEVYHYINPDQDPEEVAKKVVIVEKNSKAELTEEE